MQLKDRTFHRLRVSNFDTQQDASISPTRRGQPGIPKPWGVQHSRKQLPVSRRKHPQKHKKARHRRALLEHRNLLARWRRSGRHFEPSPKRFLHLASTNLAPSDRAGSAVLVDQHGLARHPQLQLPETFSMFAEFADRSEIKRCFTAELYALHHATMLCSSYGFPGAVVGAMTCAGLFHLEALKSSLASCYKAGIRDA